MKYCDSFFGCFEIMGGRKSRTGAIIGAAIIVLLPKLLDDIPQHELFFNLRADSMN